MNITVSKSTYDHKIDKFFWNTRNALGPVFNDLMDSVGLPNKLTIPHQLPASKLINILEKLNVSLDSMMSESVDFECMKTQYSGQDSLPERYLTKGPMSSRYTAIGMMNFIKNEYGEDTSEILMKHFQLKSSHFQNLKSCNNFFLPMDLCNYIFDYFGEEAVEQMGESSVEILASSSIGQQMAKLSSTKEMFDFFFSEVAPKSVEKNYLWSLESNTSGRMIISGTPNPEIKEAFGNEDSITLPSAVSQRKGFIKGLLRMKENRAVSIKTTREIQSNKLVDFYHIEYQRPLYH